jgi:hypothetical protein
MQVRDVGGRVQLGKFALTTGFRVRIETTLIGKLDRVPVKALTGIGNALLECSFMTRHRESEMGSRYFRARLTGDREERWAV